MESLKSRSFKLNSYDQMMLADELNKAGYNVVMAEGEADVYIAKVAVPFIAISGDSDVSFHSSINCCT